MNRRILIGALLLGTLVSTKAFGIAFTYEGFDYPNDNQLIFNRTGGYGWATGYNDNDLDFTGSLSADDTSLNSAAFPFTPIGDRIAADAGETIRNTALRMDMTQDGTVLYASFLFRKSVDGGDSADNVEFRLISNLTTTEAFRFGSTSSDAFFIDSGANAFTGDPISLGDTYFMVLKAVSSAAGEDQFFASTYASTDTVPSSEPVVWDLNLSEAVNHVFDGIRFQLGTNASGEFDEVRLGHTWGDVAVDDPTFVLGDFNNSSDIDPGDLAILATNLYTGTIYDQGDIDFNGMVNLDDFNIFSDIYTAAGFTVGSGNVPEPSAGLLLAAGATALLLRRRSSSSFSSSRS